MNRMMTRLLHAACLGVALAGTVAQAQPAAPGDGVKEVRLSQGQFETGAPLPAWVEEFKEGMPATQDKSPLVTLLADTQMSAATAQPSYHVRRIYLANASSAVSELGRYSIDFNPAFQRAQLHALRIVRGNEVLDKLGSARITFLQRETGLEQGVYSGTISASILIDDVRVGDALDISYTVAGENPVIGNKYVEVASWDQPTRTEVRRVTFWSPVDRQIGWRMLGDANKEVVRPDEQVIGKLRRLRWETRGLARVEPEKDVPADFMTHRAIQFSEYREWSDVSTWAQQLFLPQASSSRELDELVARFNAKPTPDERVSAALGWVQDEIRYFSLALGESSHRPAAPTVSLQRRYGDCKDKSLLLIHLLRAMGIQAQPVLVNGRAMRGAGKLLPTPYAFDHVIVRASVDGKAYFLDPTRQGQGGKLAAMGQIWEGAEVLVVEPGNNAFTTINSPDYAALSRNDLEEKISVPKFGADGEIMVRQTWSGAQAEFHRLVFAQAPREAIGKALLENYERRYPGAQLAAAFEVEDDPVNNLLTLAFRLKVPKPAISSGGSWGVRYGAANFQGALPLPPASHRLVPLALPPKGRLRYTVEIELPPEVSVVTDPFTRSVKDDAFEFSVSKGFRGNRATASYDLLLKGGRLEPADVATYVAAVRRAMEIDRGVVVVTKEDIKSAGTLFSKAPTLQQMLEGRLTESLDKIGKAIDGGRLGGEDLAQAYCDRAEALVDLGKPAEAMKDAQLAVKTSPNLARAYECRANVQFGMGEFSRAIADYTKAITLDPEASSAYYRRGHARFYAGHLAAAAEDFAKAATENRNDGDGRLYAEVWRLWTLKRLGQQPTADQVKLASADPQGEWPRPALAMLHGLMSVEDMLKLLDRKKGDDREMALAEAYFYAGQWFYAQGDKTKAADYFQKTREKGVIMYIEHVSAGIELRQLPQVK
jgi:tetratricopeptide (TPR) repeat protein/transglutaminase-like putative cysteine protease